MPPKIHEEWQIFSAQMPSVIVLPPRICILCCFFLLLKQCIGYMMYILEQSMHLTKKISECLLPKTATFVFNKIHLLQPSYIPSKDSLNRDIDISLISQYIYDVCISNYQL